MAAAIPWVIGAGTVLGAASGYQQGQQQKSQAYSEAAQMQDQAKAERAQSEVQAMEDRRQARLAESRALAVGAASGADATSGSMVSNISNIESQGELNALTSLWGGNDKARQLNNQASMTKAAGRNAGRGGIIGSLSTLLQGGGSLYAKYGGGSSTKAN